MTPIIRPYNHVDKIEILHLFDMNSPDYFAPEEHSGLVKYLSSELEDYYVIEADRKIYASGGINYFKKEKIARLSWDLVHPDHHRKGFGKSLVKYRLELLKHNTDVERIVVRTSQMASPFYEKMDFNLTEIKKNYWAKGFDLYLLQKLNHS